MPFDFPSLFAAGLLTFLSPCVLPLVPIYLGLLAGASVGEVRAGGRRGRLVATATAFALGLGAVFVALGLAATAASRVLSEHRTVLLQVGGAAVIVLGLRQLGLLRIPLLDRERRPLLERLRGGGSLVGAFAFGAAFSLGWTPCVGPVLGAVLTYAASASSSPAHGALLLAAYAAGIGAPLVAVAAVAPRALALLDRVKPHLRKVELATGAVLVLFGALLAADRLAWLMPTTGTAGPAAASAAASPAEGLTCAPGTSATGAACDVSALSGRDAPPDPAAALAAELATRGPRVVEIVSERCPVCDRMQPVVAAAKHRCAGNHLRVDQHKVESAVGAELSRRHAVRGVPTFLLFDASGAEVSRLVGEQPLAALERAMHDLTGGRCAERDPGTAGG